MMSFGGTAFASSPGTHPHLSGTRYVKSDIDNCALVTLQGSGFLPSTTTTQNMAYAYVVAWSPGLGLIDPGPYNGFSTPVDSQGSFSASFPLCNLDAPNEWIQIASQDATTSFLSNIILTIANGRTSPGPLPRLSGTEHVKSSGGCANLQVNGSGFVPSTTTTTNIAQVSVFASTDFQANGTIFPIVDSSGSFSAILPICGLGLAHDLIQIGSEDITSYLYANLIYTLSDV